MGKKVQNLTTASVKTRSQGRVNQQQPAQIPKIDISKNIKKKISQQKNYVNYDEKTAQQLEDKIECQTKNDQQIVNNQKKIDVDAKMSEILERIKLNIIPLYNQVDVRKQSVLLPIVVQYQVIKSDQKQKQGIDLVLVVDVSGSMDGEKIKLVQDSIRCIQKILTEQDRISIVSFDSHAEINLPWTSNIPSNKQKIKKSILNLNIRSTTNIASGVILGLKMIKNRKYKNPVTCMFVLTDGQDDNSGADQRVAECLKQIDIQDSFLINTFGYGSTHDANVMNKIASLRGGNFTYIENIQQASEHFVLSMGGILSILAENVTLQIQENENYKISKIYGDEILWTKNTQGSYEMKVNYLKGNREYALVLDLPQNKKKKGAIVLKACLDGEIIEFSKRFSINADLVIRFQQQNIQQEPNQLVEINYLRAKGGDIIGQAKNMAQMKQFDQAQELLNSIILEIEKSQFKQVQQLVVVLEDLQQAKQKCQPNIYHQGGEAFMIQKMRNHIRKEKCSAMRIEWDDEEEEEMQNFKQGKYSLSDEDED